MIRKIIKIDEDRYNDCGLYADAYHKSAITKIGRAHV